jgi:hypothetical protein
MARVRVNLQEGMIACQTAWENIAVYLVLAAVIAYVQYVGPIRIEVFL